MCSVAFTKQGTKRMVSKKQLVFILWFLKSGIYHPELGADCTVLMTTVKAKSLDCNQTKVTKSSKPAKDEKYIFK